MKTMKDKIRKYKHYISYIPYFLIKPKLEKINNNTPRIIVSFTTYPERVKYLPLVIGSIVRQAKKPDAILLYISKKQFDNINNSIFKSIQKQGVKIILVDDDLKSHKKYFYAMQEFPESIIITIDDDVIYDRNMIKDLYESYLKHPRAVSAKRVHKILFDQNNKVLPYNEWKYETTDYIDTERFDLLATGCGGILYPPKILDTRYFDSSVIKKICLQADDLWLKVIELLCHVPVVLAKSNSYKVRNVWGTVNNGLAKINVEQFGNDIQLKNICDYFNIDLYKEIYK